MYKKILCPVDGSATSRRGLAEAIALCTDQQASLRLLHVVDAHFAAVDMYSAINIGQVIDILRASGNKVLDEAIGACRARGIEPEPVMLDSMIGRIGDVIVRQAKEWPADLIVMGTHGRRGASHLLMGSDAETVVRTSPVPVLLVRGDPAAE